MQQELVNRSVLVLVLVAISAMFLSIIKPFLVAIFLAALFSALFHPVYLFLLRPLGGREALASSITMLLVICFVFIPLAFLLGAVFSQAVDITASLKPWFQEKLLEPEALSENLQKLPFYDFVLPFSDIARERMGEFIGIVSKLALDAAQAATVGTFNALLMGFIVLYTMFFFLMDGDRLLYYILYYLPLRDEDEKKLLNRFTSVTRATLKGTAVIGVLQGSLAGVALAFGGIPSALFWAVAMMFLSVVPGIGTALVWIPAVVFIALSGDLLLAVGIGAFCAVVVGGIDNLLRPKLVGSDTQLHELLIFFSTLGGLLLFGFWGFVIGPIIAALFVTIWELYGEEFSQWLPTTAYIPASGEVMLPRSRLRGSPPDIDISSEDEATSVAPSANESRESAEYGSAERESAGHGSAGHGSSNQGSTDVMSGKPSSKPATRRKASKRKNRKGKS